MPEHPPAGKTRVEWYGRHWLHVLEQVNGDHGPVPIRGAHHLDGYVVQGRPVDQQVSIDIDGWEDARQRQAGPYRAPQCAALVNDLFSPGQVGGHAEETPRQVLDGHRSEVLREEPVHPAARRQRDQRERGADEAAAAGEGGDGPLDPLRIAEALGVQRTHDRPDAGPAHDVDGHAGLL